MSRELIRISTVVGISAGRPGRVTDNAVRMILEATGLESVFFSLGRPDMKMCLACSRCVESNRCALDDELGEIALAMEGAEAVVFGAPQYWTGVNARARGFWERICFSGRHREVFPLAGKPALMVAVSGSGEASPAIRDLEAFMSDARLRVVDQVSLQGEYACFTCGYGPTCMVGGYVGMYEPGTPVTRERIPCIANQYPHLPERLGDARPRLRRAGQKLARKLKG